MRGRAVRSPRSPVRSRGSAVVRRGPSRTIWEAGGQGHSCSQLVAMACKLLGRRFAEQPTIAELEDPVGQRQVTWPVGDENGGRLAAQGAQRLDQAFVADPIEKARRL